MSLVEFDLAPIAEIQPWGSPPDLRLHWFGLTLGSYFLDVGEARLLEYVAKPRHVEYPIARLHEDLLEMLPDVLDPLPRNVSEILREGSVGSTIYALREGLRWKDDGVEGPEVALEVLARRELDTGYLSPSAGIWTWSDDEHVFVEWDNRGRQKNGEQVWTATRGRAEFPRGDYLDEVRGFHHRLMLAMDRRADAVERNWSRSDVQLDIAELRSECRDRAMAFEAALRQRPRDRDWSAVATELASSIANSPA